MQLGMIGLGRMGANMVRRLLKGGHQCVVFDMSPKAVEIWQRKSAVGASALADLVHEARQAAGDLVDGPGGRCGQDDRGPLAASRSRATSLSMAAIPIMSTTSAAPGAGGERHQLCRCRHQRRRLGAGARLLHDDRRDRRRRAASRSDLQHAGARHGRYRAHTRTREARRHRRTRLSALRAERRRPLRQDGS